MYGPIRSFREDLGTIVEQHSGARAVLDAKSTRVWTYGAIEAAMRGMAGTLAASGLRPGGRVVSALPNGVEQLLAFLATLWSGADFCPLSPLSTRDEALRLATLVRPAVVLVPTNSDLGFVTELRHRSGGTLVGVTCDGDIGRYPAAPAATSAAGGRLVIFTSGTTAEPKAMVLDGDRLWSSAVAWVDHHEILRGGARFYDILPMSYLGGLFNLGLIPLAAKGSVVLTDPFASTGALRFWRDVREHQVDTLWLTPTIMRSLFALRREGAGFGAVRPRVCFAGMAASFPQEKARFEELFAVPVLENYALSETTFLTSEGMDRRSADRNGVGTPLPWVSLRIRSGHEGEIMARTPFLFDGYLDATGSITRVVDDEGYFATGDLGTFRADGELVLRGRTRDIVKKGGYLVMLKELEEVAAGDPRISESAAVGVAHDYYGETPVLVVSLESDEPPTDVLEGLRGEVTRRLARFKWPSEIVAVGTFPHTDSGKIRKAQVVEQLGRCEGVVASVKVQ